MSCPRFNDHTRRLECLILNLMLVALAVTLWPVTVPCATSLPVKAKTDSLCRLGQQALEAEDVDRAADLFAKALDLDRKLARAHCGMGYVYLKRKASNQAHKAFRKAQKYDRHMVEAYNGIGLVYKAEKKQWVRAIEYFSRALGVKPDYVEAQYNIGMIHFELLNRDGIKAFKRVVEMDPNHPDAYYRLGFLHEVDLLKREEATAYYEKQLEVNPGHQEAMLRLGQTYRYLSRTDDAARTFVRLMHSEGSAQRKYMLELAEVYLQAGEFKRAETLFETFLAGLTRTRRFPYDDISPVARPEELEVYRESSGEDRKAFLRRFWKRRDPTPITEVNERLVEHYRRVAHALERYGEVVQPWDRRGEVYVRYGEPDHRSGSRGRKMEGPPEVRAVKQRLLDRADWAAEELLRDYAAADSDSGGAAGTGARQAQAQLDRQIARSWFRRPAQDLKRAEEVRRRAEAEMAAGGILPFLGRPIFPITERMSWEYWTYADVIGGIEVVFAQVSGAPDGVFDYAVLPAGMPGRIRRMWEPLQPEWVMQRAMAKSPDAYMPASLAHPLPFAAYPATFRGQEDSTRVEVYFGFPSSELTPKREQMRLQRGAVLYDASGDPVYRSVGWSVYRVNGELDAGVIPDVVVLHAAPGAYYLSVQAVEEGTGRTQVYGMPLQVPDYREGRLRLSTIELAASIEPASAMDAFVKHELRVVPLATRFYARKLHVFIYYEVYGLERGEFGQTAYRVAYTVRPKSVRNFGVKVLAGLGRLVGVDEEETAITISYEQTGTSADVASYLGVDMSRSDPGEYTVEVVVIDSRSGRKVSKKAAFKIE